MAAGTLLDSVTSQVDGNPVSLRSQRSRDEVLVQVNIANGSATVEIYGRAASRLPFLLLHTVTTSSIVPIARVAEIKAKVTSISGATVDAEAFLDE
jgi:hypothetical protein